MFANSTFIYSGEKWIPDMRIYSGTPFFPNLYGHNPNLIELIELITGISFFLNFEIGRREVMPLVE
jgi:hypothetical protein